MRLSVAGRWRPLTGYAIAGAGTAIAFLAGDGRVAAVAVAAATVLAVVAALVGMRRWTHHRGFALAVAVGLALLSVEHIRRLLLGMGHATNGDGISTVLTGLTYACLLGAGVLVVLRHAPTDKGGVIDAAVTGIAGAGPLWEFLMRPVLQAHATPAGQQLILLAEIFALLALVGALGRISATTRRARFSLAALYTALATALVGFVVSVITTDQVSGDRAGWVSFIWICCYLSLGASILHPDSPELPNPERYQEPTLTMRKLVALGSVLTVLPLAGSAPEFAGRPADGMLIAFGTVVAVPLVLLRIGLLIAQRAADQRALAELAANDDLTGLPNRRTMMGLLGQALGDPASGPVTLLYCDLDGFKPANDTYGHQAGDEVLRVVARRLRRCLRAQDTVGRLGGDEFLVLCRGASPDEGAALQSRIEGAVGEPVLWDGTGITVGVTVGRVSSAAGESADALIAEADRRMYGGKRARVRVTR